MVRMAMGDQRPLHGPDRIDVEVAERAIEPLRGLGEDVGGTQRHGVENIGLPSAVNPSRHATR